MSDSPYQAFCAAVLAQIRCRSAHAAVAAELTAHLEDKAEALAAGGLSQEEAQAAAVAAMGDPEAVGRDLDRLHNPHLEWLVPLVHFLMLLAATAAFFVLCGVSSLGGMDGRFSTAHWMDFLADGRTVVADLRPGASVRAGWYAVSVPRAVLTAGAGDSNTLYCAVEIRTVNPWLSKPGFIDQFQAMDASGAAYAAETWYAEPFPPPSYGRFVSDTLLEISDLPPELTELTLAFPRGERPFFLTLSLTGGDRRG